MSLLADYPGRGDDFTIVEVKKLSTIMRELGHNRIDLLKLDIEGCECEVLDQMLEEQIFPTYLGVDFDSLNTDREKSMRTINKLQKSGYVLMHQDGPDMEREVLMQVPVLVLEMSASITVNNQNSFCTFQKLAHHSG